MFQTPSDDPNTQLIVISFLSGMFAFLLITWGFRQFQKKLEKLKLPITLILDLTTFKLYNVGYYEGVTPDVLIPLENQVEMQMWAVQTSGYFIIPSFGDQEDLLVMDRGVKTIVIIVCQLIGTSEDGEDVHAEWCRDVFPPEMYDVPQKLATIPSNYVFVRALGERGWIRGSLRQGFTHMKNINAQLYKVKLKYEQQMEQVYSYYDGYLLQQIQRMNEIILSSWSSVLEAYDFTLRERPVCLYVMARLLHIPENKVAYTSLNAALSHGGFNHAAHFVSGITQALQGLAKGLNYSLVSAPLQKMITAKTSQLQGELSAEREKNRMMGNLLQASNRKATNTPSPSEIQVSAPPKREKVIEIEQ